MKLRTALLLVGLPLGLYAFVPTIPNADAQTETNLWSIGPLLSDEFLYPSGLLQGGDGDFYGTTYSGRADVCGCGTVFRVSPSGSYTNLYTFASYPFGSMYPNGPNTGGGLAQGSDGNFYGTTPAAGRTVAIAARCFGSAPAATIRACTHSAVKPTMDGGHWPS